MNTFAWVPSMNTCAGQRLELDADTDGPSSEFRLAVCGDREINTSVRPGEWLTIGSHTAPRREPLRGSDVPDRSVWAPVVVVVAEPVELGLQLAEIPCGGLVAEPFLERLLEPLDLPARLRVIRRGGDRTHARFRKRSSKSTSKPRSRPENANRCPTDSLRACRPLRPRHECGPAASRSPGRGRTRRHVTQVIVDHVDDLDFSAVGKIQTVPSICRQLIGRAGLEPRRARAPWPFLRLRDQNPRRTSTRHTVVSDGNGIHPRVQDANGSLPVPCRDVPRSAVCAARRSDPQFHRQAATVTATAVANHLQARQPLSPEPGPPLIDVLRDIRMSRYTTPSAHSHPPSDPSPPPSTAIPPVPRSPPCPRLSPGTTLQVSPMSRYI